MKRMIYPEMLSKQRKILVELGFDFDNFQKKTVQEKNDILFNLQVEYIGENKERNNMSPVVSVCIPTYQHINYIQACIEGALMQETSFSFEIIIGDDGSTDGTADLCKEYAENFPNKIRFYNRTRELSRVFDAEGHIDYSCNWWWTLEAAKGKYIAICEGDDYWIDPQKLQKQVDFLEEHQEYGLVHTYFDYVNTDNQVIDPPNPFYQQLRNRIYDGYIWDYYLVNPGFILTCTCCFRKSLYRSSENVFFDYGLFMMIARQSKVYCLKDVTASYRINPNGAMRTLNKYYKIKERNVRIEQLYQYCYNHLFTLNYYRTNTTSKRRIGEAYLRLLVDMILGRFSLNRKFLYITWQCPSLFLKLPWYLFLWSKDKIKSKG